MQATSDAFANHKRVQHIARRVLSELPRFITPTATERSIATAAAELLKQHGVSRAWYYGVPALVLAGPRSCTSISGRDYVPDDEPLGDANFVTVDLSPEFDGCWGDCARSFAVENGVCTDDPTDEALRSGLRLIIEAHEAVRLFAQPSTSFDELYSFADTWIRQRGYECLDFRGNFGHSIVRQLTDRIYIEHGNHRRLEDVGLFTFEPHIRKRAADGNPPGQWGFKHEEIYFFDDKGRLALL